MGEGKVTDITPKGEGVTQEITEFSEWLLSDLLPFIELKGNKDFDAFYHTFAALAALMVVRNDFSPQAVGDMAYDQAKNQQEFQEAAKKRLN